ncbi:BTB/POZ domain-containing protein [Ditylenchus destructor]|nr:BTB/POZ domain-containing protein [Ditylenchus destructor]
MTHADNDYTDLVIVAEDQWYLRKQESKILCVYNTRWWLYDDHVISVICEEFPPERENCHAEVLFISNNVLVKKDREKFTNDYEPKDYVPLEDDWHYLVVIRILEDKQKILKEFDNRSAADVTFVVNGEECKADRMWMGAASPVFKAMLYGQFAEAQQDKIVLEGIESAEIFKDFLLAISPLRIQPNPSNVVALLKLAHQYDIPFLMRNCEDHLLRCYEISIADRILLAGKYGLEGLKISTVQQLSDDVLQEILKEKQVELREPESSFLFDIIANRIKKTQKK